LGRVEEWIWYVVAAVTYIGAGVVQKGLLNWIVGPIWLVTVVVGGPWLFDRVRQALGRREGRDAP